jgi:hypothetical protein
MDKLEANDQGSAQPSGALTNGEAMTEFSYVVTVKVPDEGMHLKPAADTETGDIPFLTPKELADIVVSSRLRPDEDNGFEYRVEYVAQTSPPLPPRVAAVIQEIKRVLPEGASEDWENDDCFAACSAIKELVDPVPDTQFPTFGAASRSTLLRFHGTILPQLCNK